MMKRYEIVIALETDEPLEKLRDSLEELLIEPWPKDKMHILSIRTAQK